MTFEKIYIIILLWIRKLHRILRLLVLYYRVLELGCGTALPALYAALHGAHITLQDYVMVPIIWEDIFFSSFCLYIVWHFYIQSTLYSGSTEFPANMHSHPCLLCRDSFCLCICLLVSKKYRNSLLHHQQRSASLDNNLTGKNAHNF